jgi:DNA-binding PucR family transcriptional regulator
MARENCDNGELLATAAAAVIGRLDERLAELTCEVQEVLVVEITELGGDALLVQLLRDTVAGNIETGFAAIRNAIPIENVEAPAAALEYARRLAQRGVSATVLARAYRLGHKAILKTLLSEVRAQVRGLNLPAELGLDIYEPMRELSFDYVDSVSQTVVAVYQEERDRWLQNQHNLRAAKVREILGGADIDIDAATIEIGYPLHRIHLAVVVWSGDSNRTDDLASLDRLVAECAEAIEAAGRPLFVSMDQVTAWGWIPLAPNTVEQAVERARAVAVPEGLHLAVGIPLAGVAGFRQSHRQALAARDVATASDVGGHSFIAAGDPGVGLAALLGGNVESARKWVGEVLGPLASDTESDGRLCETLRAYLGTGASFKAAAEELHLHANSVKYRVSRAVKRRGRPIAADRLDVEVALLLSHWFGHRPNS